jgi:hypothetical protein
MNQEFLEKLLNTRPFIRFSVFLSSGQSHAVRYPRCALLTRTRLMIVDPDADTMVVCALLHITKVEMLQGTEQVA